jgi:coenzyme F420-0:L-glutamate ligase/coenzyme F420-1:gamma-L-glutamate ligase
MIELWPVEGLPEFRPGDDLAAMLAEPLRVLGIRDGDVVAVTQKIVSKAEGRVVPAEGRDRSAWIARETRRVVARRGDLVIAETRHGFVCANAGVDASNVEVGFVSLLPEDPDASAENLRVALCELLALARLGVVVTDTFGRPWRNGLVNVAIGCSGLPAIVDLRGGADHHGRELEMTVVALADEIAAASGLVMGKAARVPAALVRGIDVDASRHGRAAELVRAPDEDLFRESMLVAISARSDVGSFGAGGVPRDAIEESVRVACASVPPAGDGPGVLFTALMSDAARKELLGATGEHGALGGAPALIVPWLRFDGARSFAGDGDRHAEQGRFLLVAGAAIQNLLLAMRAQGLASCWSSEALFHQAAVRAAVTVDDGWFALGTVGVGRMPEGETNTPRPPIDLAGRLSWR